MNQLTRLLLVLSIVIGTYATLAIVATFSQLADAADRLVAGVGTPLFWGLVVIFLALVAWPVMLMMRLPRTQPPPRDQSEPSFSRHQAWLKKHLSAHPDPQVQTLAMRDQVPAALALLDERATQLVRQPASAVFVSTALIQNGRLDGLVMLGMQLKLIWQLAALYCLRPTPRQLTYLYGNVAGTLLLSSQLDEVDLAEMASPIVASVAPSLAGAVPGMQGIGQLLVNSIASGSANAFLTLRVGMIAKAYCMPSVEPLPQAVRQTATRQALSLLGHITQEQGQKVAKGVWSGVRRGTAEAVQTVAQGSRNAAREATDAVRAAVGKVTLTAAETTASAAQGAVNAAKTGGQVVLGTTAKVSQAVVDTAVDAGRATAETVSKTVEVVSSTAAKGAMAVGELGSAMVESTDKLLRRKRGDSQESKGP